MRPISYISEDFPSNIDVKSYKGNFFWMKVIFAATLKKEEKNQSKWLL